MKKKREIISVFGIVQGVGFRPFIHKLVNKYGLNGWVKNSISGVIIDVEGENIDLQDFIKDIRDKAPSLAFIEDIKIEYADLKNYNEFKIIQSEGNGQNNGFALISPDVSICDDCLAELRDPFNKRYRFPFINCTNCGPRFTIIKELPYDRYKTTMDKFNMCSECNDEYYDIDNRRYHAQPNCCKECGPKIKLIDKYGNIVYGDEIKKASQELSNGAILAIKGIGGFHLACNALDINAVRNLRKRKQRKSKPFAMMCRDIETIRKYVCVNDDEMKILKSEKRPIVLLKKIDNCIIPEDVAPFNNYLGFMLAYTPLHYLLFENGAIDVLVMTSGNISDNPIIYENDQAFDKLNKIADYFLINDREINTRCDDSVVKVIYGKEYFFRRSRGYAPFPIKLNSILRPILACGAEQKASFCLSKEKYVFMSQHMGDLKNYETYVNYEVQINNFKRLFNIKPEIIACDLHPDYLSTSYAENEYNDKKVYIQHHHAHMASCMADNNISLNDEVIGVTLDGTGLGSDGTIWGGEILIGGYRNFKRVGSFLKTPMPGGDRAIKDIYLMALSYLITTYGSNYVDFIDFIPNLKEKGQYLELIFKMVNERINSPETSSCGRLFDAVSCLIGLCSTADYEGQGAVMLEAVADNNINDVLEQHIINIDDIYIYDWRPTIENIIKLVKCKKEISYISSVFHNTIVSAVYKMCVMVRNKTGINKIVLSGGVFQNVFILCKLINKLENDKFEVFKHSRVSTNDEGLSLGQLIIAQNGGGFNVSGSTA